MDIFSLVTVFFVMCVGNAFVYPIANGVRSRIRRVRRRRA